MSRVLTLCSAAAVLAATGAFAQMSRNNQSGHNQAASNPCACMEQGMGLPTEKKCFPAAYNAPASIAVSCGWDFDISASFLYWYVSEEGLDAAHAAPGLSPPATPNTGAVAYQDFSYQPGFQVAVGYNTGYDDWTASLQYTWMHQSVSTTYGAPRALGTGGAGSWLGNDWFVVSPGNTATTALSTGWKMNMDMLDLFFSRPYYQGTQLTVSPYGGIRALWIRQAFNVDLTDVAALNPTAKAKSNSWAIGAATGADIHWLLGMGFRFEGNATGALLYTQYTTIGWKQSRTDTSGATASTTDYSAVRPVAQLGLGLGYGSYLYCQKFYVDFSARYDFNYFWNQNVMRPFVSELAGRENDRGDLSMHGLTLNARFDF